VCVMGMKTMKIKRDCQGMWKPKQTMAKVGLNLILNIKHENQRNNMKCVRKKCKWNFIMITN